MEITIKIKGKHSEEQIKKALDGVAEVRETLENLKDGIMVVTLDADASAETLKKAVEEQGYKVID